MLSTEKIRYNFLKQFDSNLLNFLYFIFGWPGKYNSSFLYEWFHLLVSLLATLTSESPLFHLCHLKTVKEQGILENPPSMANQIN